MIAEKGAADDYRGRRNDDGLELGKRRGTIDLVTRVKNILLNPKAEWPVIEREPGDVGTLFTSYVAIVAAIPPVCTSSGCH